MADARLSTRNSFHLLNSAKRETSSFDGVVHGKRILHLMELTVNFDAAEERKEDRHEKLVEGGKRPDG